MQTVSEINNYPEPKFLSPNFSLLRSFAISQSLRDFDIFGNFWRFRHFWRHLASAINRFLTASQFRYFSIATRFRNFWRHLASAIRRFLTASQFRYFSIATRYSTFVTQSSELSLKILRLNQDSPPQSRFL